MAEKFNLSQVGNRTIHTPTVKKRRPSPQQPKPSSITRLFTYLTGYPFRLWSGYYLVLIIASISTGIIIEKSRLASTIMDWVRNQESTRQLPSDHSSFYLKTDTDMYAYVIYPNGKRAGESAEGIRYFEVGEVSFSASSNQSTSSASISTANRSLLALKPPHGNYIIDFSSHNPGIYGYYLQIYGLFGYNPINFSGTLQLQSRQHLRYSFRFDKTNPENSSFQLYETL